jgi:hypothetical protein
MPTLFEQQRYECKSGFSFRDWLAGLNEKDGSGGFPAFLPLATQISKCGPSWSRTADHEKRSRRDLLTLARLLVPPLYFTRETPMPEFQQENTWVTNLDGYQFTRGGKTISRLTANKPQYTGKIWMEKKAFDMNGEVIDNMCSLHCDPCSRNALYDFWLDLDKFR